jgi:tetratricopeptide (TPR) repeat protein
MGQDGYTSVEVAALSGLKLSHIRALARAGVIGGKGVRPRQSRAPWRFTFMDVRLLRNASALMGDGLKQVHMQRTLTALKAQVGERTVPLSGANLVREEGRILASDGHSMWDTESGQTLMWYEPKETAAAHLSPVASVAPVRDAEVRLPNGGGTEAADAHFVTALACEGHDPQGAYQAYLLALACDPTHVEATMNIGRLCSAQRDLERAVGYFTVATCLDPAHAVAQFNLAVSLHDLGRLKEAEVAYRHALVLDPDCRDAQVNLNLLLSDDGLA